MIASATLEEAYRQKVYSNDGNIALLQLLPATAQVVLDLGCGAGDNARLLHERGCKVYGVTLSPAEAEQARKHCEQVVVANIESESLPFPDQFFDTIIASHVLEHLVSPSVALRKLHRYIKPKGTLLIAVPNMAFWRVRARVLFGNWRREDTGAMDRTHLQFYSFETAPQLLDGSPFTLDARRPGDLAVPLWPLRRMVPPLARALDKLFGTWIPNFAAIQVLLVARATEETRCAV